MSRSPATSTRSPSQRDRMTNIAMARTTPIARALVMRIAAGVDPPPCRIGRSPVSCDRSMRLSLPPPRGIAGLDVGVQNGLGESHDRDRDQFPNDADKQRHRIGSGWEQ